MLIDRLTLLQKIGVYIAAFLFLLFVLMPFIEMIRVSLRPMSHLMTADFTWWSEDFSLQAYRDMWETVPLLKRYILNSIFIASAVTVLTMAVVVPAAYAYARLEFPFKSLSLGGFLAVNMFTGAVLLIPLYRVLRSWAC